MAYSQIPIIRSKSLNSVFPELYDTITSPNTGKQHIILYSYSKHPVTNEKNLRILKQNLKNLAEVLLIISTFDTILKHIDEKLKILEQESLNLKSDLKEIYCFIELKTNQYKVLVKDYEFELKKINSQGAKLNGEHLAENLLLSLFRPNKTSENVVSNSGLGSTLRYFLNLQLKISRKTIESLLMFNETIDRQTIVDNNLALFRNKLNELQTYGQEIGFSLFSPESEYDIDIETLNSRLLSLISTYKTFETLCKDFKNFDFSLKALEKQLKINEKIRNQIKNLESQETRQDLISKSEKLNFDLNKKLKDLRFETNKQQDKSIYDINDTQKLSTRIHEEKILLSRREEHLNDSESSIKSFRAIKLEQEFEEIQKKIKKNEEKLENRQKTEEKLKKLINTLADLESEHRILVNNLNSQLSWDCERYQQLINLISKPSIYFSSELISPLIGVFCEFLCISGGFSQNWLWNKSVRGQLSVKRVYACLAQLIQKNTQKECFLCQKSDFDLVNYSETIQLNQIIDWLLSPEVIECIKTQKKKSNNQDIQVDDVYNTYVEIVKRLVKLIMIKNQLLAQINSEALSQILKTLHSETARVLNTLGYKKLSKKIENFSGHFQKP